MMFLNVVCFSLVFFGFASLSRFLIFHPIARSFSTRRRVVLCVVFVFPACRCCMVQVLSAGRWWLMLQVGAGCSYVFRSSSINEAISQAIQQAILKPNYSYLFISRSLSPSMYLVIHLCSYLSMYLHIWTKWHIYIYSYIYLYIYIYIYIYISISMGLCICGNISCCIGSYFATSLLIFERQPSKARSISPATRNLLRKVLWSSFFLLGSVLYRCCLFVLSLCSEWSLCFKDFVLFEMLRSSSHVLSL